MSGARTHGDGGDGSLSNSNRNRSRKGDRRRTISGALPPPSRPRSRQQDDGLTPTEAMRFPWSSPSAPTSPAVSAGATGPMPPASPSKLPKHRRTISGGFFSKLNFLRPSPGDDVHPPSREKWERQSPTKSVSTRKSVDEDAVGGAANEDKDGGTSLSPPTIWPKVDSGAMAFVLKQKTRQRKGSLRKTAMMGGKRVLSEARERRGSLLQRSPSKQILPPLITSPAEIVVVPSSPATSSESLLEPPALLTKAESAPSRMRRQFSYEDANRADSADMGGSEPAALTSARLALVTRDGIQSEPLGTALIELSSPDDAKSPVSQASYPSTTTTTTNTDEEDNLSFDTRPKVSPLLNPIPLAPPTSYFPLSFPSTAASSNLSLPSQRRKQKRSPLSHHISSSSPSHAPPLPHLQPPPHSYASTETWGWTILASTWLVFTVGMGSTLEIWSWAWDVGETPYAPPELEDDPTLPIVGYYPALMVLTGVVAWVWITVAWVGMKYFRHARVEV